MEWQMRDKPVTYAAEWRHHWQKQRTLWIH